jgi:hypothetical protein
MGFVDIGQAIIASPDDCPSRVERWSEEIPAGLAKEPAGKPSVNQLLLRFGKHRASRAINRATMTAHRPGRMGNPAQLSALALAAALLAAPVTAHGQEQEQDLPGLRGTVAEDALSADADAPAAAPAGLDNQRVAAIEARPRAPDDDPYAPIGIRAGTFVLRPQLEQGIGWTSNAGNAPGGRASVFSETALRLDAQSDWSRHRAAFTADGSYRKSLSGDRIDEIDGGVTGRIDFDLAHELAAFVAAGYRADPESASTPGAIAGAVEQPLRHTLDASAGLSKDAGPLRFALTGALARETFDDAELTDGTVVSQRDRDSTLATATLRAGYAISPALAPFVEAEIGRRIYDETLDSGGYARSADRYALRGGVAFDFGEKLNGEIAAGWLTERPDDSRLDDVSGLSLIGNVAWSPVRGTTLRLTAGTTVETAAAPGEAGSLLYTGNLALERQLRANLTGRAVAGLDWRDYAGGGHDLVMRGEASLTWWMNRYAGITARASHEVQESSLPGRDWDATRVWLGMTLQR